MNFCTLFDSYYLDKAIALYRSLERQTEDFTLYIFAFDEKSFDVLSTMDLKHAVILRNTVFENDQMLKLKEERSKAEYCWTCTPVVIEYVLDHFNVDSCTYIDADLYFFSDPKLLIDEIEESGGDIGIMPHRFPDTSRGRHFLKRSGKYCVEFNYFNQTENSRKALTWWKERCLEWCYHIYEADRMGDQKYIEKFPVLFKNVHEFQYLGGGVAPWNLNQYVYYRNVGRELYLKNKKDKKEFKVIFYHFQNLRYLSNDLINISSETHSKATKDALYRPYLKEIKQIRQELLEYGVNFGNANIHASNKLIAFMQGTVLRFKVKSLSDLYRWSQL